MKQFKNTLKSYEKRSFFEKFYPEDMNKFNLHEKNMNEIMINKLNSKF